MPPTLYTGLRTREQVLLYDDPEHPARCTRVLEQPEWTEDDRALVTALGLHDVQHCRGCGEPKSEAWHSDMEGWYDPDPGSGTGPVHVVCHSCSARQDREVVYVVGGGHSRDLTVKPLTPLVLGVTTSTPTETRR